MLQPGQNIALTAPNTPTGPIEVSLTWDPQKASTWRVVPTLFFTDGDGKVTGKNDIMSDRAMKRFGAHRLKRDENAAFVVNLDEIPKRVQRIAFTLSMRAQGDTVRRFKILISAAIQLKESSGQVLARFEPILQNSDEISLILGEFYRHDGGWKFRALGQGFKENEAAMYSAFGADAFLPAVVAKKAASKSIDINQAYEEDDDDESTFLSTVEALAGILLFIAVFLPMIDTPKMAGMDLWDIHVAMGSLGIAWSMLALGAGQRWVWIPGVATLGMAGWLFYDAFTTSQRVTAEALRLHPDEIMAQLSYLAYHQVEWRWGLMALFIGGSLLIISSISGMISGFEER
ncbi:MAG: TerD family protein [Magnetococcales bacterium]|nr:TerD family protein [Magnetococcales bacterium]